MSNIFNTALAEGLAQLNQVFGEVVTIDATATSAQLSEARAEVVETDTGHQRVTLRRMTVNKSIRAASIARGTTVTAGGHTYKVRSLAEEDAASRTYEIVK